MIIDRSRGLSLVCPPCSVGNTGVLFLDALNSAIFLSLLTSSDKLVIFPSFCEDCSLFRIDLLHCLYFLPGLQWVYNSCGQLVEGTESYSSYSSQRNRKNGHYNTQEVCCHWNAIETEHLWSSNDSKVKVPWCQVIIMNKLCPLPCTCFLLLICVLFSFI